MATAKLDEFRRDTRSTIRHYWILFLFAGVIMVIFGPAAAQPFTEIAGGSVIGRANALAARIHAFHRWTGSTPPPASYCPTMRAGRGGHGGAGAARQTGDSLPPAPFGAWSSTGGPPAG